MLRVTESTVQKLCRRGLLTPIYAGSKRCKQFKAEELEAVSRVYGRKMDLSEVAMIAQRALVTAKANERAVEELLHLLRLKRRVLDTSKEGVLHLWERAKFALERGGRSSLEDLEDWSLTLNAVDETYLSLVELVTQAPEPWKPFLDLAHQLMAERPVQLEQTPDFRKAFDMVETSRRNLRAVAYFYCRERRGVALANDIFGTEKVLDRILNVMFAD